MRPFLTIGLGGSGGKTIRYLKKALDEWLEEIGWPRGIPQAWQFIHIDTPDVQDSPILPGNPDTLPPREYLSLHREGVPFKTVVDLLQDKGMDFDGWWVDPDYMHVPIAFGAGQYRAIGRVIGNDQRELILRSLQGKITALRTTDAIKELQGLGAHFGSRIYQDQEEPVVIIISSLAGGTGAGLFLDVADMLRAESEPWLDNSFGILYAADVFRTLAPGAQAGVHPNTAAALAELLNGVYAGEAVPVVGDAREIARSGPAFPFLVGHANTSGVVFGDQTDVYRVMGRCLKAVMTDPQVQDDFVVYTTANWQQRAGTYADTGGPRHMLMEPPYLGVLQGLGYAEVDLGIDRFKTYCERRITRDAVDTLVRGHRLRTAGLERYEGLTPEATSKELADERLTGLLDRAEINERGPAQNQIIEAIALPLDERKRITGTLAQRVYDDAIESIGKRARVGDWIDAIVEAAELLSPKENESYDSRLRERARIWTEKAPGRLTGQLGELAAELGLHVVLDLLELIDKEIEWVAEELETERSEFESFTTHLRSNVQAAFGDQTGQMESGHEAISIGSANAVDTMVFQRMEEKARFIARELIRDFGRSIVAPLKEAIRSALGDLQRKLNPADLQATPVDGWPRHSPTRDQAPSDDLVPGSSVQLVIDPKTFPQLFNELLASTLGRDFTDPGQRQRHLRHQSTTGAFLQESPPSDASLAAKVKPLFEVVDSWQPSEAILLGGEPDRPARYQLHVGRDDLILRARAWMAREGSDFQEFLSLGLRDYLREPDETVSAADARAREVAFQGALESAFEAAEPLVHIDRVLVTEVHGKPLETHVVPGEIPLANHRLEKWVGQFLDDKVQAKPDGQHDNLTQNPRVKRISVYSMLDGAYHPAVFQSLIGPIADGYGNAIRAAKLMDFWKWRRSRPLAQSLPLPMPMVRALIRGWFISRFLQLIEFEDEEHTSIAVLQLGQGGELVKSPPLVNPPGSSKPRQLGSFLETLALAVPYSADAGRADEFLGIYAQLIELGRTSGTKGAEVGEFRELSPVLEEWVTAGTAFGRAVDVHKSLQQANAADRAHALANVVLTTQEAYENHGEVERQGGRIGPENAWLGVADLVHEELHRLAGALQARAVQTTMDY